MNLDSHRHHYIPQFFIKAFTNDKRLLWIYDKDKNKILNNPLPSKSIFFEDFSNSIEINGKKVAIIEMLYNGTNQFPGPDQDLSNSVKELQYSINDEVEFSKESIFKLIIFIAQLTWRIPANETINKIILSNFSKKYPDLYKSMSELSKLSQYDQFKFARYITPSYIIREAHKISFTGRFYVKIIDIHRPVFCLTDSPIIWETFPSGLGDFTSPLIFPINKNKAFVILDQSEINFSKINLFPTIMILMHQAKRYIAFHDKAGLQIYVNAYQEYKKIGDNQQNIIKGLFERIRNKSFC